MAGSFPKQIYSVGVLTDLLEYWWTGPTAVAPGLALKNIEKQNVFEAFLSETYKNTRFLPPSHGAPPQNLRKPMVFQCFSCSQLSLAFPGLLAGLDASCVSPGCSWVLLGASWVPPGCPLGASWVPPGCLLGVFWVVLGADWVPSGLSFWIILN